jgi:hypothetical protein
MKLLTVQLSTEDQWNINKLYSILFCKAADNFNRKTVSH